MRKQDALKLARRMLHTRIVPQGMELAYVDWKSGEGRHYRSGDYVGQEAHDALVGFMAAMTHPGTRVRVEVVRGGSYEG